MQGQSSEQVKSRREVDDFADACLFSYEYIEQHGQECYMSFKVSSFYLQGECTAAVIATIDFVTRVHLLSVSSDGRREQNLQVLIESEMIIDVIIEVIVDVIIMFIVISTNV